MLEKAGIDVTRTIVPINMWLKRSRDSQVNNPNTKSKRMQQLSKQIKRNAELVPFEDAAKKIALLETL
eukprot:5222275-Prorocentrum_lima.AAC.1